MSKRIQCVVPFCRASRGDRKNDPIFQGMEWICSKHYRLVDRSLKLTRSRFRRRHGQTERGLRVDLMVWNRMKRQAIERAAGI